MQIKINGKNYKAKLGETVLDVCRRENVPVPTLCAYADLARGGACRMCLVQINLTDKLVTACTTKVCAELEVTTESERLAQARRINLELLWADHAGKCVTCKKNRVCELQKMAEEYKIENFHFVPRKGELTSPEELELVHDNWSRVVVEEENPCIARNSEFCIECRRCVNVCPERRFGFNHRAGDVVVGTPYNQVLDCSFCGKCVEACPTAALTDKNDLAAINAILDDLKKFSVAVVDAGMDEKLENQITRVSAEKDLDKLFFHLGFEKVIRLEKDQAEKEDLIFADLKTRYAKEEKIAPENIISFFITDRIAKKAAKGEHLDYVLSEREVARLARDKEKMVKGKIRR